MQQHAAHKDAHQNVGGLVPIIVKGDNAGPDGFEGKNTVIVGPTPAKATEIRVGLLVARVSRMLINPLGVGLPDFDQGIIDRPAGPIHYPAFDINSLANSAFPDQNIFPITDHADSKKRADRLAACLF
jgi:hypothetical protein